MTLLTSCIVKLTLCVSGCETNTVVTYVNPNNIDAISANTVIGTDLYFTNQNLLQVKESLAETASRIDTALSSCKKSKQGKGKD